MKKLFLTALAAAALLSYAPEANAQSMMKKLKTKVGQVTSALNGSQKNNTPVVSTDNSEADDYDEEATETKAEYAEQLLDVKEYSKKITLDTSLGVRPYENGNVPAKTFSQVLAARPAFFDPKMVFGEDGMDKLIDARETLANIETGLIVNRMQEGANANQRMEAISKKNQQIANSGRAQIGQEVMAAAQARGINLSKATEAQMQDVTAEVVGKKLGIPKADMLKIYKMQPSEAKAFIRKNYPEAEQKAIALGINSDESDGSVSTACEQIYNELEALQKQYNRTYEQLGTDIQKQAERMQAALDAIQNGDASGADMFEEATEGSELRTQIINLRKKYAATWASSEACAQVTTLMKTCDKRTSVWLEENPNDTKLPQWWVESKKEMNAIIRAWNMETATKFNNELKQLQSKEAVMLKKVAQLDDRLNAVKDKNDVYYVQSRAIVGQFQADLFEYIAIPFLIKDCPQAEYLNEDPTIESRACGGKG